MDSAKLIFPANNTSSVVLYPGKESFYFPPSLIPPKRAPILRRWRYPIFPVWRDHLYCFLFEPLIKWITVVSSVTNESSWSIGEKILFESVFNKGDFMW